MPTTIVQEIETVETSITKCENRLDRIERSLRLDDLTDAERATLEKEEKAVEIKLKEYKQGMSSLRVENFKSMLISLILLIGVYFIYNAFWT